MNGWYLPLALFSAYILNSNNESVFSVFISLISRMLCMLALIHQHWKIELRQQSRIAYRKENISVKIYRSSISTNYYCDWFKSYGAVWLVDHSGLKNGERHDRRHIWNELLAFGFRFQCSLAFPHFLFPPFGLIKCQSSSLNDSQFVQNNSVSFFHHSTIWGWFLILPANIGFSIRRSAL